MTSEDIKQHFIIITMAEPLPLPVLRFSDHVTHRLCQQSRLLKLVAVFLYVHRNRRFIRDGSPIRPPRLSHSSWTLTTLCISDPPSVAVTTWHTPGSPVACLPSLHFYWSSCVPGSCKQAFVKLQPHTYTELNAVNGSYWPTWSMKAYSHYEHGQDMSYGQQGHFITRLHKLGRDQLNLCRLRPTIGDVNEVHLFMWPLHDHQQIGSSRGNQHTNSCPPTPTHPSKN